MDRRKLFAAIGLSVALFLAATVSGIGPRSLPAAASPEDASTSRVIAATGEATVSAKPDIAYVSLGVNTQAPTAEEAQRQNNASMNSVMATLKQLGIADDDIRTSRFDLYPVYDHSKPEPQSEPRLTGYRANNAVTVTVRDLNRVGAVLDQCVKAGANQVENVTFALKDAVKYRNQALEEAARSSRAKAEAMAKGLGLAITGIRSVQEVSGGGPVYGYVRMYDVEGRGGGAPVAPGTIDVRAEVRVEYTY